MLSNDTWLYSLTTDGNTVCIFLKYLPSRKRNSVSSRCICGTVSHGTVSLWKLFNILYTLFSFFQWKIKDFIIYHPLYKMIQKTRIYTILPQTTILKKSQDNYIGQFMNTHFFKNSGEHSGISNPNQIPIC